MFQSYKFIKSLGYKNGEYSWEYELIDSEFGTVYGSEIGIENWIVAELGVAVIQEYSKRNLNVAANLAVAFVWFNKLHSWYLIEKMIENSKNHNPLFLPYEEDINKYLPLL